MPCLLSAGSGLLVLLAVASESLYPYIPAAVSIVTLSVALHQVKSSSHRWTILVLGTASWALSIAYSLTGGGRYGVLMISSSIGLGYIATAVAALTGGWGAGLAAFGAMYAPLIVAFSYTAEADVILSAGYVLLGSVLAAALAESPYALLGSLSIFIFLPLGVQPMVALSLLAYITVLAGSGALEWRGCPFKLDSGLVFMGALVGSLGAVFLGGEPVIYRPALGLYSLGLLLILAGVLTPSSTSHSRPS